MNLVGRRYLLHASLGAGGMGMVYHATDRLTGQAVALKRVNQATEAFMPSAAPSGDNSNDLRLALAQEFRILAGLRHPNIISVLDYGFDADRAPYFTMELLENARTIYAASVGLPLTQQVNLIIQVCQALEYLHRHEVLHRDLKPANVLVTKQGTIKVLDFGLSVTKGASEATSGTMAYMAPESLMGQAPSIAADLYAVGLLAYEVLAGHHPFAIKGIKTVDLIDAILLATPDLVSVALDPALAVILDRLLQKKPEDRYKSATEVIHALSVAIQQPPPVETDSIRDSYLQAAPFIGREAEQATLVNVLDNIVNDKAAGQLWLIGGESGVGKSRLVEEVRVQALVRGAIVLRGQALDAGNGIYQLWRDVLRWLALLVDLSELEVGVLSLFVPDIQNLLGYTVRAAPELSPDATQMRLFKVVEDIIVRFVQNGSTQPAPEQYNALVIILEDLQWAGESLALLNWLNQALQRLPVLILGSYRSDESPDLPLRLPNAQPMKLERLSGEAVTRLTEAMLGQAAQNAPVIDFIQHETEGNIFFLIEVIRTLAEQAGQLQQIGQQPLPATAISGGLRQILQKRLDHVPSWARPLLQIAAATGRDLDLPLLEQLRTLQEGLPALERWLLTCAETSVLEVREDSWRFAHDKLREALLVNLSAEQQQTLHRQVGTALEQMDSQQVARLAYHWRMAGDMPKERHYSIPLGQQAIQNGAYQQAIDYLERALALPIPGSPAERANVVRQLAYAYLGLDNTTLARRLFGESTALLGFPIPTEKWRMRLGIARAMLIQLLHRIRPRRYGPDCPPDVMPADERERLAYVAQVFELHSASSYFLNDVLSGLYTLLNNLNLVETAGEVNQLGSVYSWAALGASMILPSRISNFYVHKAILAAERTDDDRGLATALQIGGLVATGRTDWNRAEEMLQRAITLNQKVGDLIRWQYSLNTLVELCYFTGQYERSLRLNDESFAASMKYGFGQVQTWGLRRRAMNLFRLGQVEEAARALEESIPFYAQHTDLINETNAYGLLASIRLRQGDLNAAVMAADTAAALVGDSVPTGYYLLDGYNGIVETRFAEWEAEHYVRKSKITASLDHALKNLQRYAQSYTVGKARVALFQGKYQARLGNMQAATKDWQKSLEAGQKFAMPYDQALAHLELGLHGDIPPAQKREHLTAAAGIFRSIGTPYELSLTEQG